MDVQYSSQQELEDIAKREQLARKGKDAVIESFAKKNDITFEEARRMLYGEATVKQIDPENKGFRCSNKAKNEATAKQKSPVGMTDEKFDKLDDNTLIVVTAGMIRQFAEMIRAEERLKNRAVTLDEMLSIAESTKQ